MSAGRFITVEGVEGAGKSTQVATLAAWLRGLGLRVETTSEPDGSPLGFRVRQILQEQGPLDARTETFLFGCARAEHVRTRIRPWLDTGAVVVCDRFTDSTVAYQGYGREESLEVVHALNRLATDGLVPDLTLILDLDVAEGLRRARSRPVGLATALRGDLDPDPFERLGLDFHERVRKGYRAIHEREPGRVELIDAGRAEREVTAAIQAAVQARLGLGRPHA
jgi:dTMP kinase